VCCLCGGDGAQQCHDCHAWPLFCTKCCWDEHALCPFHRISQWNGDFFERTTLTKLGVKIHTGHRGKPWQDSGSLRVLPAGKTKIMVVDTSGVHTMMVRFCRCPNAETPDRQLFEIGLFPASFTRPKTVFTFALLDDFILDNL
ncbi:hypothetical protein EDD22DRAFT_773758, partial [Suillus occidentalis]